MRRVVSLEVHARFGGPAEPASPVRARRRTPGEATAGLALTIAEDIARIHGGFLVQRSTGDDATRSRWCSRPSGARVPRS